MLSRLSGQELIDGLSAMTLGASALGVVGRRPDSLLRLRLGFAFGALFLLFALRTALFSLNSPSLHLSSLLIVCTLPLAALLLTEGVLRRHAPWPLKVLVTLGAVLMATALIIAGGRAPAATWGLGTFVIVSLLSAIVLLLARDRTSLSQQENAGVAALVASGLLLTLLSLTDFLARAPVGLSGIGAAAVAFVLSANPSSPNETANVFVKVLVMGLIAAASALVFAQPLGLITTDEIVRLAAIILALLLSTSSILAIRWQGAGHSGRSFAQALAKADTSSLERFLNGLADQPLLADLHLAEGAMLAEYETNAIARAMAGRPVWTRMILADRQTEIPARARDELSDLLARTESTHALMISRSPLRIALLTLSGVGPSDTMELNLALFGKLAAIAAGEKT